MPWAEVLEVDVNRINDDWDGKREEVIEFLEDMSVRNPEATVASTEKMLEEGATKEAIIDMIKKSVSNPVQSDPKVITAMSNTVYCIISGRPTAGEYIFHKKTQLADEEDEAGPHIVCLHGTAMNEQILRAGLGRLISSLKGKAKVTVIQGGNIMVNNYHPRVWEQRQFYNSATILRQYAENTVTDKYEKLDEGVEFIETKMLELSRPADFVLGFSQGAMLISALALRWDKGISKVTPPKGVLLLCPPDPECVVAHFPFEGHKIRTRALLVRADNDPVVAATAADDNAKLYENCQRVTHPEGHQPLPGDVEASKALVEKLIAFIGV